VTAFADVFLPILSIALLGAFAWEYRLLRKSRRRSTRRLARTPFRKWLSAQCNEIFGFPWERPADGHPLTDEEMRVFAGYAIAEREERSLAAEPKRARRRP
jgi:hypothetical protein